MPKTPIRILEMPPPFELEAIGEFLRIGPETFVRYDQIAGVRGMDVKVGRVPLEDEEPDDEDDEDSPEPEGEAELVGALNDTVAKMQERVVALQAQIDALPTVRASQLYFVGGTTLDIVDGEGRRIKNLICPFPEGEILAKINMIRTGVLRNTGRLMSEGAKD